jgi:predicted dehydrogenase
MKLKALLVGYGYWGPNLARNLHQDPGFDLLGVIEADPDRANVASNLYSVETAASPAGFLNMQEIQVVFLATKPASHFELAKYFIEKGINVVIPKPVTTSISDARKLFELAKKFDVKVFCDYTYIYSDNFKYMKEWANKNNAVSYTSYRCSLGILQSDVDVVADLASHDFSMLYKLTGSKPDKIWALDTSPLHYFENSTSVSIFAKWKTGFTAEIHVSWNAPKKLRKITLSSNSSSLLIDETNILQQVSEIQFSRNQSELSITESNYRNNTSYTLGEEKFINLNRTESLASELRDIHYSISSGTSPEAVVDLEDAIEIWRYIDDSKANMSGEKHDSLQ